MKKKISWLTFIFVGLLGSALFLNGCDGGASEGDGDDDGDDDDFSLSTAAFTNGGTIPDQFACEGLGGENDIPSFSWSGASAETQSFAMTLIDLADDAGGTIHMVAYDIPSTKTSISDDDDDIDSDNFATNYLGLRDYAGPCPVGHTDTHTYELTIYALNTASLGIDETEAMDAEGVIDQIRAADIDSTTYRGTFTAD